MIETEYDVVANSRREEALRAQSRQQAVVAELGKRALTGIAPTELLNLAAESVAKVLRVEYCKVLELLEGREQFILRAGFGWEEGLVGTETLPARTNSQAGYTLLSQQPVIVEDLRTETRFSGPPLLQSHGVISGVSVIIYSHGYPYGVLGAHTTVKREFTQDEISFLQSVANVLGAAIERVQLEEDLRDREKRYRRLFEQSNDAILIHTTTGQIQEVNQQASALTGYDREQLRQMTIESLHPQDQLVTVKKALGAAKEMQPVRFESKFLRPDSSTLDVEISASCIDPENGIIEGIVRDITDRRQAELALRESEVKFRSLVEHSPDIIMMLDRNGKILYINDTLPEHTFEQVIGTNVDRYLSKEHAIQYQKALQEVFRFGEARSLEVAATGPSDWLVRLVPQRTDGDVTMVTVIATDISERKQAQDRIAKLSEENRWLARKTLEVVEEERKRLALELHDELGQTISAIKLDANYIDRQVGAKNPKVAEAAEDIRIMTDQISLVTRQMMERLHPLMLRHLGLVDTLREMVEGWQSRHGFIAIVLKLDADVDDVTEIQAIALYRVVQESLTNVAKYSEADRVTISLQRIPSETDTSRGFIRLTIEDNGKGLDLDKVSAGIGLLGMRERIESLGGQFELSSRPGCGLAVSAQLAVEHNQRNDIGS